MPYADNELKAPSRSAAAAAAARNAFSTTVGLFLDSTCLFGVFVAVSHSQSRPMLSVEVSLYCFKTIYQPLCCCCFYFSRSSSFLLLCSITTARLLTWSKQASKYYAILVRVLPCSFRVVSYTYLLTYVRTRIRTGTHAKRERRL